MKKLLSILLIIVLVVSVQAQTKEEKKLKANLASIAEVEKMLQQDYVFVANTATEIPSNTFKFSDCMVLTSYADEGINKDAKVVETEFGKMLNGSIWQFGNENKTDIGKVKVIANGQTEEANFATSGGMFNVTNLINGFDIQAGLYQNKKNKSVYMITFGVKNSMACFANFTKQTASSGKTNDLKTKENSKLLNKTKK